MLELRASTSGCGVTIDFGWSAGSEPLLDLWSCSAGDDEQPTVARAQRVGRPKAH
jgi:hypothetical protein